jgi:hypothetical protein
LLASEELDIIDKEHVGTSISIVEVLDPPFPEPGYELVGELLSGDINDFDGDLQDHMSYGMQQMCLSQSHATIDKERVITAASPFRNPQGSGMSQAI